MRAVLQCVDHDPCATSAAVVANLWDVTDKDIDRFTVRLLQVRQPLSAPVIFHVAHTLCVCVCVTVCMSRSGCRPKEQLGNRGVC